jgi:hypothetical protein
MPCHDDGLPMKTCAPWLTLPASLSIRCRAMLRVTRVESKRIVVALSSKTEAPRTANHGITVSHGGNAVPVPALPPQGRRFAPVT